MDKPYELHIDARRRTNATAPITLTDFAVTPGAPVETQWLVHNPNVSLYSFDAATSQAIFVELAPETNLAAAPFVYQAQYEGAQRLFAMSYGQLLELGASLESKLDRLILLFNINRCGSTLLHQVFNQVPGVVSLSEPDGFVPFWSEETRLPADEAIALMQASAKFLFRPQAFPHLVVPAVKFRSRSLRLLELCNAAFPHATLLFLYRDAMSWVASWVGVAERSGKAAEPETTRLNDYVAWMTTHLGPISLANLGLGNLEGPLSPIQDLALTWLILMDYHLQRANLGLPITAWRYADLNHRRQETLSRLFATCDLPLDAVQLALAGFERDSQKGTVMARAQESQGNSIGLNHEQEEEIRALIRCHPLIQTTDFIAPSIRRPAGSLEALIP
jgi:hypothetical protein